MCRCDLTMQRYWTDRRHMSQLLVCTYFSHDPEACCGAEVRCIILMVPHLVAAEVWASFVENLWCDNCCTAVALNVHNRPNFETHLLE